MMETKNRHAAEQMYYDAVDAMAEGDLPAAVERFRAAIDADDSFLDAWHGLIRSLQDMGNLEDALATALRLAALEPDDVLVHTRLSILYQMQGKIPEAEAEAAKARILGWKQELKSKKEPVAGNLY